jgi:hypothetical protein
MFMQHFVHSLSTESTEYLNMASGGVFVQCTVEEGKLILEKILFVTPLDDLQPKAPELSEDVPIITYPDTSDIPTSLAEVEFLQLTALKQGSNEDIADHAPSPLFIVEDLFDDDVGGMSKFPTCDIKGLNVECAEQDLEEFLVAQENLLELSAIISRDWTKVVEEDDFYIRVYPEPRIIYCCCNVSHSRGLATIQKLELTFSCWMKHLAWTCSHSYLPKNSLDSYGAEHAMQVSGSHNHRNRRQ